MFHIPAHKNLTHPAAQVAHPPIKSGNCIVTRALPDLPSGNVRGFRKATRARLYERDPSNTGERLAARSAMTDEFRLRTVIGEWHDDAYCLDAPVDIPGGSHWQGGRYKRTAKGRARAGTVYPTDVARDGFVNPYSV